MRPSMSKLSHWCGRFGRTKVGMFVRGCVYAFWGPACVHSSTPWLLVRPENHHPDPGGSAYGHFYYWWGSEGVPALGSNRRLVFKFTSVHETSFQRRYFVLAQHQHVSIGVRVVVFFSLASALKLKSYMKSTMRM